MTPSPLSIVPEPSSSQFPVAPDGLHLQLHWELRPEPWERGHKGLHSSSGGRQALVPQPAFLVSVPSSPAQLEQPPFQCSSQSSYLRSGRSGFYLDGNPGGACEEEGNDPPTGKAEKGAFFGYIPPGLLCSPPPKKKQLSTGTLINHRPKNKLTPGHLQSTLGLPVGSVSQTNGPVGEMESAPSYWEDLSLKSVRSPAPNPGQRAVGT